MEEYVISGVWKSSTGAITHYALHKVSGKRLKKIGLAIKTNKNKAIEIVKNTNNKVSTWTWNYSTTKWEIGEEVILGNDNKDGDYLRSNPNDQTKDNLAHLINFKNII